jgi:histidine triad (HIT) family protein
MSDNAYDAENVFAKILRGELPCHKIYEDDETLAFLDIMPRTDGHTLIVPKGAARNILDVTPEALTQVILTTQKMAKAAMQAFEADGISLFQFTETAGGQIVFHLHFHVLPRHTGVELGPIGVRADDAVLAKNAEKLRAVLQSQF